jgi:hypothetical protein
MRTYTKIEVFHQLIKSFPSPLTVNIKTLDHLDQLTVHIGDRNGERLLKVSGSNTPGIPIKRLQTLEGMGTLISGITKNLKSRGYL